MNRVIRLFGDPHLETERLLPWYAMGQLDPADRAKVDAHLADCAACQMELRLERKLGSNVAGLSLNVELGWAQLRRRLDLSPPEYRKTSQAGAAIWRMITRPRRIGWFVAAQAATILIVAVMISPLERPAPYRTLGTPAGQTAGNVIVIFQPDASEADLRRTLNAAGARVVNGPTSAGAYILRVSAVERSAALAKLRAQTDVVLAQPIDPAAPL